jgi:Fe-S cluster biosynthesis and repair protein YggX
MARIVHCKKLDKDLPGLERPPYKNDLGKRIFEEVSKEAWEMWLKDSVKYINTYRVDLASTEGQKFMFDQAEISRRRRSPLRLLPNPRRNDRRPRGPS